MIHCPNPANRLEPLLKEYTQNIQDNAQNEKLSHLLLLFYNSNKTILQVLSLQALVVPSRNAMLLFVTCK